MFYNYFLPVCGLSFQFLNSVFHWAEVFHFHEVLFINFFPFVDCIFDITSKKSLLNSKSPSFFCYFLLSFSSAFYFMSLIHSELIFMKGVRSMSLLIFFACGYPVFPVPFVEQTILCSFVKDQLVKNMVKDQSTIFVWVYFWALYSVPFNHLSVLWPISHYLDYNSFTVSLKVGWC